MSIQSDKQLRKAKVKILNPRPGGSAFTSQLAASDLVLRRQAEWCGEDLLILDRKQRTQRSNVGVDSAVRAGMAKLKMIRNLPVVGNVALLMTRRSTRGLRQV